MPNEIRNAHNNMEVEAPETIPQNTQANGADLIDHEQIAMEVLDDFILEHSQHVHLFNFDYDDQLYTSRIVDEARMYV